MTKRVRPDKNNTISLYDLPKDILVHMISTIERDTREPLEKKIAFFERMCDAWGCCYGQCNYNDCKNVGATIWTLGQERFYGEGDECQYVAYCQRCAKVFCDDHILYFDEDIDQNGYEFGVCLCCRPRE